jgi:hypothetical protein
VISPPGPIEIPIDLRISKNLSQPGSWMERSSPQIANNAVGSAVLVGYDVQAQNSWDFRLLAGIGAKF